MSNPLLARLTAMDGGNAKKCREHFWPWAPGISTSMYKKARNECGLGLSVTANNYLWYCADSSCTDLINEPACSGLTCW